MENQIQSSTTEETNLHQYLVDLVGRDRANELDNHEKELLSFLYTLVEFENDKITQAEFVVAAIDYAYPESK